MRKLWNEHPNLVSWAALALGMAVIVVIAARNVGFLPGQWAAIIVATIALAGLCVWIISWEDGADESAPTGKEQDAAAGGSERAASDSV
jgi:hypothetical protein